MIVVLDIATIAPVKTLSSTVNPSDVPTAKPAHTIRLDWMSAVSEAAGPTRASRRRLNSSPSPNMSRMTPSSDRVSTTARSATSGIGTCGPTISPASR